MPDAAGNFKGQGWSARKAAGWERAFGPSLAEDLERINEAAARIDPKIDVLAKMCEPKPRQPPADPVPLHEWKP